MVPGAESSWVERLLTWATVGVLGATVVFLLAQNRELREAGPGMSATVSVGAFLPSVELSIVARRPLLLEAGKIKEETIRTGPILEKDSVPYRRARRLPGAVLLLGALAASVHASGVQAPREGAAHPQPALVPLPHGTELRTLHRSRDGSVHPRLDQAAEDLRRARPAGVIGQLSDPASSVLGTVTGVVLDEANRVYVLDSAFFNLRVFTAEGQHLATVGGPGEGPGEFTNPVAAAIDPTGRFVAVGEAHQEVEVFRVVDGVPEHELMFRTDGISVMSLCHGADGLYVLGGGAVLPGTQDASPRQWIHRLPFREAEPISFGEVYASPHAIINLAIADGLLACAPDERRIMNVPKSVLPIVRSYDEGGELQFATQLAPFVGASLVELVGPRGVGYRVRLPTGATGFNRIETMQPIGDGILLVQVSHVTPPAPRVPPTVDEIHTYLLDRDGSGVYVGDDIELLVAASRAVFVFLVEADSLEPYPRLIVAQRRAGA